MDTKNQMNIVTSDDIEMKDDEYSDEEDVDCNESMNVNNGDDSSSSSMSSDEDGQLSDDEDEPVDIAETEKTIAELEQQLQTNPYYYDGHVQLIACLKKLKDLQRLKVARTAMSSLFPLTEELWMDWIKDEEDGDQRQILLEKAIADYDSTQMWLEFAFHHMKDNDSSRVRDIFERALAKLGLHSNEGSLLWDAYREYEMALLAGMQPLPGSMLTNEQQGLLAEQTQRVAKLFSRQLSCPLIDLEKTYQEYKDWTDEVDPQVSKKFESSQEKLKTFLPFEEKLLVENSLENYNSYLEHAISNFDPSHINCLFERAVKDHPIQSELWVKYARYLEKNLKIKDVVLGIYRRSVRNCPWCLELWTGYLQALEKYEAGHVRIRSVFNDSLLVGFSEAYQYLSLWTAYIDYLRRRVDWTREGQSQELEDLRDAFDNANNQLLQTFSSAGDPTCSLLQYQALVEAKYCKNMAKAREIFSTIMQQGLANQATPWLQYAQLERSFGDVKHCRKVFQRALNSATDWPEYITEAYIRFEREEGDLDHYLEALEKCQSQMVRIEERRAKESEKDPKNQRPKVKQQKFEKQNKSTPKNLKKDFQNKVTNKKGARGGDGDSVATVRTGGAEVEIKPYVKTRTKTFTRSDVKESQPIVDSDGFKVPPPPPRTSAAQSLSAPPPGYKRKLEDASFDDDRSPKKFKESHEAGPMLPTIAKESSSSAPISNKPNNDLATVFVSNLEYSVTRDEIKKIFEEVGDVKEVRLISNFKGQSKGYAYVEFVDEMCVFKALKMDRKPIGARPMYVSKCDTSGKAKEPKLKFSVGLEKNKLFVKNLNFNTTKETLEKVFKTVGPLKDVRIVTYRNGKSKGLAYVEYLDEASATQAIFKLDGHDVDGYQISVALSNPPARNQASKDEAKFLPTLGSGKKDNAGRGARIQMPMVPRSVAKQSKEEESRPGEKSSNQEEESRPGEKLSNQAFRDMLLKK